MIKLHHFTNANDIDHKRVAAALQLLKKVINSKEFHDRVLDMTYELEGKTYSGYTQTNLSPSLILESILEAQEDIYAPDSRGVIDLNLDMYYSWKNVLGYTTPDDPFIHMNRKLHSSFSPAETAGNIFHEWLHKIGHGHTFKPTKDRPYSVPYAVGYLVREMAAKYASKQDPLLVQMSSQQSQSDCSHH